MTVRKDEIQIFSKGEKVLCYDPDPLKVKVLYDSKILGVIERKDEDGIKYYEYQIHFNGWKPSYDSVVRSNCLLKDNEENRQLQRELAIASKLQVSGGYAYKDTKTPTAPPNKKKRPGRVRAAEQSSDPLDISPVRSQQPAQQHETPQSQKSTRTRDNSGGRKSQAVQGDATMKGNKATAQVESKDDIDIDKLIIEPDRPIHQEDRVMLRISERLREYMEYDYNMVVTLGKQHTLPARMPIVTILESFVKQRAVELAIGIKQDSSRARNTQSRNARMEREYDRVMSNVCLLKEVVDGLRIYFEFLLDDQLLYKQEKEHTFSFLNEDNMKFYCDLLNKSYDFINPNCDTELMAMDMKPMTAVETTTANGNEFGSIFVAAEYENQLQKCLQYIEKSSGNKSTANAFNKQTSPYFAAYKLPMEMRGFLWETFSWRLLTAESQPEKSMVFGAPHLARLLVKLPEHLNASPMPSEKLEELLPHLDLFINYLENHKEWFDIHNYVDPSALQEQLPMQLLDSLEQDVTAITSN